MFLLMGRAKGYLNGLPIEAKANLFGAFLFVMSPSAQPSMKSPHGTVISPNHRGEA
jgi:hypothetical protein